MYKNHDSESRGYCLLFALGIGFIIVPLIAVYTVLTDGWENTPHWMQFVAAMVLVVIAGAGVGLVINFLNSPA